jgi:glycosyltransferase involved in cell wall biosynthesis
MTALIENYGIRMNAMVVTFIGTFGASYDLETVIAAAKILTACDIPTQIVLAGHGDKATRLQALARGLDNVVFTGWLDQLSMLALLRLSAVGLAAYTNAALQSLPNKPFEYMSAGLPLLSSLQGELETLIRAECIGVQYQAGNVQSLADNIRWLAAHPVERTIMGERARQLLEKRFAAEVIYPQLAAHLQTIARQPI